jgi:hypothetical protein
VLRWHLRAVEPGRWPALGRDRSGHVSVSIPPPDAPPSIYEDETQLPGRGGQVILEVALEQARTELSFLDYEIEIES